MCRESNLAVVALERVLPFVYSFRTFSWVLEMLIFLNSIEASNS